MAILFEEKRIQHGKGSFLDPCRKEMCFKRDLKVDSGSHPRATLVFVFFFCACLVGFVWFVCGFVPLSGDPGRKMNS